MTRKDKSKLICTRLMQKFGELQAQETILISTVMNVLREMDGMEEKNQEMRVPTYAGDIVAYPSADPEHPGICLMYKPSGSEAEIDIAYAEVKQGETDADPDHVYAYIYEDVHNEDCTGTFKLNKHEALDALKE